MSDYYRDTLSGRRLERVYAIALSRIGPRDDVLELGCGYGRILLDVLRESVRVTRAGGYVLCSSYSNAFWEHRLEWFERQADAGLIGEIDFEKTRDGLIVCKDGFTATTVAESHFRALARELGLDARLIEVDSSSIFCEIAVRERAIAPAHDEGMMP